MPGIRIGPYAIHFYQYDLHEPIHVHIRRERKQAKFWLEPIELARSNGFSAQELRDVERLLRANKEQLVALWNNERSKL